MITFITCIIKLSNLFNERCSFGDFSIGIDKICLKRNFFNMLLLFLRHLKNCGEILLGSQACL